MTKKGEPQKVSVLVAAEICKWGHELCLQGAIGSHIRKYSGLQHRPHPHRRSCALAGRDPTLVPLGVAEGLWIPPHTHPWDTIALPWGPCKVPVRQLRDGSKWAGQGGQGVCEVAESLTGWEGIPGESGPSILFTGEEQRAHKDETPGPGSHGCLWQGRGWGPLFVSLIRPHWLPATCPLLIGQVVPSHTKPRETTPPLALSPVVRLLIFVRYTFL